MKPLLILVSVTLTGVSQESAPAYEIGRVTATAPSIDGELTEDAWTDVDWVNDFRSVRGGEPEMPTAFAAAYDSEFLYVGVRLDDSEPERIEQVDAERDDVPGDRVAIFLDTTLDQETSFVFVINAAGVVRDQRGEGNNGPWQNEWNAEWSAAAVVHGDGWNAEFRIPLEALGVTPSKGDEWGLQLTRAVPRLEAPIVWRPVSQTNGWTASFGRMVFSP